MSRSLSCFKHVLAIALLTVLSGAVVFAQMGGGMMGSGSQGGMHGGGQSNGNGQASGGMMGGGSMNGQNGMMGAGAMMGDGGMGTGMMAGLTVGTDGTPYLVRRTTPATAGQMMQQAAPVKNELIALDSQTGATKWKLELTGNHVSEPVTAKDGQLFVTVSDPPMWSQSGQSAIAQSTAKLLVISATGAVLKTTEVGSGFISAPVVAGDAPNYLVYVVGYELGASGAQGSMMGGDRTLYAFYPDGSLKFKVDLSQ